MKNYVIVSTVHTTIGSFNGSPASISTTDPGAIAIKAVIEYVKTDSLHVDEVIMGNVLQVGLGQSPVRQALLRSGLAETMCEFMVNKVCGSGLKSVALAIQTAQAGQAQSIVVGGMENAGLAPYLLDAKVHSSYRLGDGRVYDVILRDGLACVTYGYHVGVITENVAKEYGIIREVQDELAPHSRRKVAAAIESGAFTVEIVPVNVVTRKKTFAFNQDEFPKADSTAEVLGASRPAFDKTGTITIGSAPGISDDAVVLVIMEKSSALAAGLTPLARIKSYASGGVPPALMGMGPVPATQEALQPAGSQLADIGLTEANEAFAAWFLVVGKTLGFESEGMNINGGAIVLGHPIGANGTRVLVTLLHTMQARDKTLGPATLYVGDGQGIAMVVERLN